jgi:hypothetical protein
LYYVFLFNNIQPNEPAGRLFISAESPSKELVTPDAENQIWRFNYYALEKPLLSNFAGSCKVMQVTLTIMPRYDDCVIKNVKVY